MDGLEADVLDAEAPGDVLELAGAALGAGGAALVVVGQEQLDGDPADLADLLGLGLDLHAGLGGRAAGALDAAAVNLDEAEPAGAVDAEVGVVAESRQLDVGLADELEEVALALDRDFVAVDDHGLVGCVFHRRSCCAWALGV